MALPAEKIEERKHYLGGSDTAAILGLSRWRTPLECWAEKVGAITNTQPETLPQKIGSRMEDIVADLFMEQTGKKVRRCNATLYHPKFPFLAANVDRLIVGEDAGLECKAVSSFKQKEFEGDDIPQEHIVQCLHYLAVTGKKRWYLAATIGNHDFVVKTIDRDEALLAQIVSREVDFWNQFVVTGQMPKVVKAADSETLFKLFPGQGDGSLIDLPPSADQLIEHIEALSKDKASVETQLEQKKNELKLIMGNNEIGLSSNYRVSWKTQHRKAFTVKESTSRVLRIREKGDI